MTGFTIAAVDDVALLRPPGADLFRAGWDDADVRIANLEAPLTQGGVPGQLHFPSAGEQDADPAAGSALATRPRAQATRESRHVHRAVHGRAAEWTPGRARGALPTSAWRGTRTERAGADVVWRP
jgi:hypothetical protein